MNYDLIFIEACDMGDLELAKSLSENGADVHACNNEALRWAADNGHLEVANYLKKHMKEKNNEL